MTGSGDPDADPPDRLEGTWPAVPDSVSGVRAAVARYAAAVGVPQPTVDAIRLAVSEAVTNAVLHAYVDADGPGPIHVIAERAPDALEVAVTDEGRGMTPRTDSPGSGFGLPLIAQMTQGFHVARGGAGGTTLHMRFAFGEAA